MNHEQAEHVRKQLHTVVDAYMDNQIDDLVAGGLCGEWPPPQTISEITDLLETISADAATFYDDIGQLNEEIAQMKTTTIYGYHNTRFCCGPNPHGTKVWFATRRERDEAVARLSDRARAAGLTDPDSFPAVARRLRSADSLDWLLRLQERGPLRANGIEGPQGQPDQMWGDSDNSGTDEPYGGI